MNALTAKISQQSTETLKDAAKLAYANQAAPTCVFSSILDELIKRLPEQEFVALVNQIEMGA